MVCFLSVTNITKLERLHQAAGRTITNCLSSSPIRVLHSEASLPALRVTLTHFTLRSFERAFRLQTSFPNSGLARHGVKQRLCRSSWRDFASPHPLMLPSTCPREALFACPPSHPRKLPSFIVEFSLFSSCFCSDLLITRQALAHLDSLLSHDLVLWTDGSVYFGKGGSGVLANCSLCRTEASLPFQQAQCARVFPMKLAPFCMLFAGLGSTIKLVIFLLFSSYVILALSSLPCSLFYLFFYHKLFGRSDRNDLLSPSVLSGYNGSPDIRFSRGTTRLMCWPDGERYLRPLRFLVVSFLLSLVSTLVFSQTGGVPSYLNSSTHRFPRFPLRNLCSIVTLAVFTLVYAATDTAYC